MRFGRTPLLHLLTGSTPGLVLLEAPSGFGKSWLTRRAAPRAVRSRGDLSVLDQPGVDEAVVVIDDAHLLAPDDVDRLVDHIEEMPPSALFVVGRYLPDAVHEAAHLVDGLVLDTTALSITADEIVEALPGMARELAERVADAAGGAVRTISTVLDQVLLDPAADAVGLVHQVVKSAATAVLQQLGAPDAELVTLLSRVPATDRYLLARLGGAGFVDRAIAAGVPLRRMTVGGFELGTPEGFRSSAIGTDGALRLAAELTSRDRPVEAVSLLLDANAHEHAGRVLATLPDSILETIAPRTLLTLVARLGSMVDDDPSLLRTRAAVSTRVGRHDLALSDLGRALELAADGPLRRRLLAEYSEQLFFAGDAERARQHAEAALRDLGPGEDRTFAFAHTVLGEIAQAADNRDGLQQAAEEFRLAIATWEVCDERPKARRCRINLASGVFAPLGQFDAALAELGRVLAVADLSDPERAWAMLIEGFVLYNANRLDSAEARMVTVGGLAGVLESPQLHASVAWARALIAVRRDDTASALRWAVTAENTALGDSDDLLGVPFLCDMATAFGALGERETAERYLVRARERGEMFASQVATAEYIDAARRGVVGDLDAQLERTPPVEWWRVRLVTALAVARAGDRTRAAEIFAAADRDLVALGFSDFAAVGERRTVDELRSLLEVDLEPAAVGGDLGGASRGAAAAPAMGAPGGRVLRVVGGPILVVHEGVSEAVPPGNPQRLVGAVVAHGGSATFDQLSEAIWPGEDVDISRARLRNVLMRLRRGAGDVVVRSGSGVRLAGDVVCDLLEFERRAADAMMAARSDPDLAGRLAADALRLVEGPILADFEYEEWAISARRAAEHLLIGLLDFLSVQAEDEGDLARAQSLAERALRLDRYSDSRYVRIAELLTLQGRSAAAVAVLQDAAEAAREAGAEPPAEVLQRRAQLLRRTTSGG